jgi:hypothetical protein
MKFFIVAVTMFAVGFAGYAAAEDLMQQDLRILADQYTAATGYGDTQLFATNFRSYMIGSNRLDAAAEQQRKIYRFTFETSIDKLETTSDQKSCVVANANYESKRNGQALAKGTITATYTVRDNKLILVMIKFSDQMVRYKDADKVLNEKTPEKDNNVMFMPGPNSSPDFAVEKNAERQI